MGATTWTTRSLRKEHPIRETRKPRIIATKDKSVAGVRESRLDRQGQEQVPSGLLLHVRGTRSHGEGGLSFQKVQEHVVDCPERSNCSHIRSSYFIGGTVNVRAVRLLTGLHLVSDW